MGLRDNKLITETGGDVRKGESLEAAVDGAVGKGGYPC